MRAIAGLIALALGASPALAAPPTEITAEQAVELMRAHSPRLQAARAEEQVTAADLVEARIYPNPSLGIASARTVHGTDTIGTQQHSINVDIPVLIGRQRGRRERAAE
ncbi:MAG: TolC family protein, partial [Kofleriaceae bacterium]